MGGFFGAVSREHDCMLDVFFGVDYHSHLGTRRGGLAAYDETIGLQREIHNIENSPFRTKFENVFDEMKGTSAIGCISDTDPQPLLIRSKLGPYAISIVGRINNRGGADRPVPAGIRRTFRCDDWRKRQFNRTGGSTDQSERQLLRWDRVCTGCH